MTPGEVQASGTRTFDAPLAATFEATVGALQVLGYEIAVANPDKGVLKTQRKLLRSTGQGVSVGYTTSINVVHVSRQYFLHLTAVGDARTQVVAEPKIFVGDDDISSGEIWALDGPQGERALWEKLFAEIQSNL